MRIQATSFRLPSLKLQPKDSYQCLSQGDNNLSSSSMIKQQSSPLRNYDPAPIIKRIRGMTIIIYNSHEKLKTADYCNGGDYITQIQQTNQSASVINTSRRYRNKLKQLMQPSKNEEVNSRDPRLNMFNDSCHPIILDRFKSNRKDYYIQEKVRQLMGKVRLLFSSQQFYQEPLNQEIFRVKLVQLKDEYDCLSQDFNDFYVQSNKLDKNILKLLNHMEIIQTLLQPKKPNKIINYQPKQTNINHQLEQQQDPYVIAQADIEENPQQSQIEQNPQYSNQLQNQLSFHEPREPSVFTPLTSKQYNTDQSISDLEENKQNKLNIPKKQKNKNNPQIQLENISIEQPVLETNETNQVIQQLQSQSQSKIKQRLNPQKNQIQFIEENQIQDDTNTKMEDNNIISIDKPNFKRTISNLGSTIKRRSTMFENKDCYQKQNKVDTISEQDDICQEDQEIVQMDSQLEQNDEQQQQQNEINKLEFSFLDMLIACINIYNYPFYQDWEFHIDEIIKGTIFNEYDL